MSITVADVEKRFGAFTALDRVSLTVEEGSLVALLGPSGSGKTTLLRVIAGLEAPDGGRIEMNGVDVTNVPARRRGVGFVFQHYALFRHMTVAENIGFPLKVRGRPKAEIEATADEFLRLVRLDGLARRYPSQLSGGQRQRVALARALAARPAVLLLDEPFGALDARVRRELRDWLRQLHDEIGVTSVFVTHDQEEALEVADRVAVMNHGRIEQDGTPDEVYDHPANPFVFGFLGQVNVFHGRVEGGRAHLGGFAVALSHGPHDDGRPASGYVRPFELEVDRRPFGESSFTGLVRRVQAAGPVVRVELTAATGAPLRAELPRERFAELGLEAGDAVHLRPKRVRVFLGPETHARAVRVRLRREPATPEETRIASLLAQGEGRVDRLAERLADLAYREALAAGAGAADAGAWGPTLFLADARARVTALLGDLLEGADGSV